MITIETGTLMFLIVNSIAILGTYFDLRNKVKSNGDAIERLDGSVQKIGGRVKVLEMVAVKQGFLEPSDVD